MERHRDWGYGSDCLCRPQRDPDRSGICQVVALGHERKKGREGKEEKKREKVRKKKGAELQMGGGQGRGEDRHGAGP